MPLQLIGPLQLFAYYRGFGFRLSISTISSYAQYTLKDVYKRQV